MKYKWRVKQWANHRPLWNTPDYLLKISIFLSRELTNSYWLKQHGLRAVFKSDATPRSQFVETNAILDFLQSAFSLRSVEFPESERVGSKNSFTFLAARACYPSNYETVLKSSILLSSNESKIEQLIRFHANAATWLEHTEFTKFSRSLFRCPRSDNIAADRHHSGQLREQFLRLAMLLRIENHQPRMKLVMH